MVSTLKLSVSQCSLHLCHMLQPAETPLEEDISLKMKRRAFAGYGIDHQQVIIN